MAQSNATKMGGTGLKLVVCNLLLNVQKSSYLNVLNCPICYVHAYYILIL
jgi:hypothetical protein